MDFADYHPEWRAISLRIRKDRAQDKCEQCGVENGSLIRRKKSNGAVWEYCLEGECEDGVWSKPVKVTLTVAHLDRCKENNDDTNLAAWCQRCHLKHDLQQHIENRKYGRNWKRNQGKLEL